MSKSEKIRRPSRIWNECLPSGEDTPKVTETRGQAAGHLVKMPLQAVGTATLFFAAERLSHVDPNLAKFGYVAGAITGFCALRNYLYGRVFANEAHQEEATGICATAQEFQQATGSLLLSDVILEPAPAPDQQ